MPKKPRISADRGGGGGDTTHPVTIFLDVDGVLHPANARHTKPFDKKCMARLKSIIDASGGALIVATSTW